MSRRRVARRSRGRARRATKNIMMKSTKRSTFFTWLCRRCRMIRVLWITQLMTPRATRKLRHLIISKLILNRRIWKWATKMIDLSNNHRAALLFQILFWIPIRLNWWAGAICRIRVRIWPIYNGSAKTTAKNSRSLPARRWYRPNF